MRFKLYIHKIAIISKNTGELCCKFLFDHPWGFKAPVIEKLFREIVDFGIEDGMYELHILEQDDRHLAYQYDFMVRRENDTHVFEYRLTHSKRKFVINEYSKLVLEEIKSTAGVFDTYPINISDYTVYDIPRF